MTRWPTVALLILGGIVAAFQIGKVPVALPLLRAEVGLPALWASAILAAISVLGALAGAVCGAFADRAGHRRTLLVGFATIAVASAGGAFASDLVPLLLARIAEGVGFLAVIVTTPSLILAATAPAHRRLALGLWSGYVPLGSAVVLFGAPAAIALDGWRALWLICALAAAVMAVLVGAFVVTPARAVVARSIAGELRAVLRAPYPVMLAIGFGGYTAAYLGLVGFLPTMLVDGGATLAVAATASACLVLFNGAGTVVGGIAVSRTPRWALMFGGAVLMGLGGAILYVPGLPIELRYAAGCAAALTGGTIPAAVMASVPLYAPAPRLLATTQGLVVQGSSIGQVVGPLLIGAFGATGGSLAGSVLMLAFAAVCAAGALILRRPEAAQR